MQYILSTVDVNPRRMLRCYWLTIVDLSYLFILFNLSF